MPLKHNINKDYFFKKSLGQNILKEKNIIRKIIAELNIRDDDVILEIGPGLGALTDELIRFDNEIIAIEKDTRFFKELKARYSKPNVHIINDDALTFDYNRLYEKYGRKLKVIANLPYNVSTEILFRLFSVRECFKSFLFMFQKEVAKRIAASPSTKDYGILSVLSQYYSRPAPLFTVPPSCFVPVPKVESQIVHFDIYAVPPFSVRDETLFKVVVKTAFAHRRKTLHNCFKGFKYKNVSDFDINTVFENARIDLKRRGETLSVEEFSCLTERFHDFINDHYGRGMMPNQF
jgi:16S rRNA (adenine1518-N6/adenine1519-N6)-dimethyltransferase